MKLMIASDIHGSAFYTEKLIGCFNKEKPDKLILLGDILYHGPRNDLPSLYSPKKVIEELNKIKEKIICVRGNCDTEVDQMVLEFPIMADYSEIFIDNLIILITHGHKEIPVLSDKEILLSGHTHIPEVNEKDGKLYLNPGSVSIPKNNSQNSYMIYESKKFCWKNLDGEIYKEYDINW